MLEISVAAAKGSRKYLDHVPERDVDVLVLAHRCVVAARAAVRP